ncbi:MAG: L-ribulose-5-phosphate 4-epimerase [Acidobacteriia bacterium]|nr:L-ribulose-5-phosphate 4-epimerase [Terriglobia bacterium]
MLESLRAEVYEANMEVVRRGLVLYTFGNASGISRDENLVAIKPSGVPYETLRPEHLVITDLEGRVVEGDLKPSSDLPTHLALYRAFPAIGGIVHTHSRYATAWAQAGREIPCLGTTHADYFHGPVPVTEVMQPGEIKSEYEWNTGQVIVRRFVGVDPMSRPGVLVTGHAPFSWGRTPAEAAHHAVVLEEIACLAYHALAINPDAQPLCDALRDKHFLRKHGSKKYYGQG